jgi:hypothetical protein
VLKNQDEVSNSEKTSNSDNLSPDELQISKRFEFFLVNILLEKETNFPLPLKMKFCEKSYS